MNTPKYFENLHLAISGRTGTPRIVNIDYNKTNLSDKYKNIPKDEFESAMLEYYQHFKENARQLLILNDWTTVFGCKANNKKDLLKILNKTIKEIENMEE